MKFAVAQINPIIGDLEYNFKKIIYYYNKGVTEGVDIVLFPELALTGYPPLDLVEKAEFRIKVNEYVNKIASLTKSTAIIFGAITEDNVNVGTNIHNSAIFCYDGKVKFVQHKSLIPNYDVFDEVRYFEPANEVSTYKFKDEVLGISICEDIWNDEDYWNHRRYLEDPIKSLVGDGATILINISASPYSYGKREMRNRMFSVLTKTDSIPLIYVCCVGAQTELIFDGASMCFNSRGELVAKGKNYEEDFIVFDNQKQHHQLTNVEDVFEKEVIDCLILGIKDYCTKLNFKKLLVGLSGGIDSAIVTYLAVQALGKENVFTVLMPSQYSSEGSVNDSLKLISNLGINYSNISIQPVFDSFIKQLEPVFENRPQDITEENLQARIRGIYLMAISNKLNYLLLTTGNKSEIATGYSTLYGDMCGSIAVIGDVYKTDIYKLCNYINKENEIIPKEIITKAPSAELRPDQKDQDTLPPYPLLDKILKMYLEKNKDIDEINKEINDYELVKRILMMVDRNEFKRKQAAPILRVSSKAFGYGRRYPIVQKWRKSN